MNVDLSGKVALVCGGSKGLGYASAVEMAKLGAQIILLSRTESLLQKNIEELNQINGLDHTYIVADISDTDTVKSKVKEVLAEGDIHILLNNSGGPKAGPISTAESQQFIDAMHHHLIANHELSLLVIPSMKKAGYGRIINMVSTSVRQPISGLGVSNTTRGAVASWAKTLSNELAADGITVNNVLPGTTKTERLSQLLLSRQKMLGQTEQETIDDMLAEIPMKRFAEAEEIGSVVAFLASPAASYITGASIPVDGGKIRSI